jgi:hypothetical protein
MENKDKKCILCGCKDHRLIGCLHHLVKNCSCYATNG